MPAFMTNPVEPITASTQVGLEQTWRPVRKLNLGLVPNMSANQVNQVKAAVTVTPAARASGLGVQGIPQPVQNLRVTRTLISPTQYRLAVSFTPQPNDPYFQGVNINLAQGGGNPVQVTAKTSPATFVVNRTGQSTGITVQSVGAFGATSLNRSPGVGLSLK